jgi:diguanylate cyclase (GGDEF)-like protein
MPIPFRQRLSVRLTGIVVACGLAVGTLLSATQIWLDYREQSETMRDAIAGMLDVLRQPAATAVYNVDPLLARHLLQGLAAQPGVREARLVAYPDDELAALTRPRIEAPSRFLTDAIFGAEHVHELQLADPQSGVAIGSLRVVVDTYPTGAAWLHRATVILVGGIARVALFALVLLAVFNRWLTQPVNKLAGDLAGLDPQAPAQMRLSLPEGHEHDELGLWAQRTNALLQTVEQHQSRRLQAERQAAYMSQFDLLTDLPNRALFYDRGLQAIQRALAERQHLAVVVCDLRQFHVFNEAYGTAAGDSALRECGRALRAAVPTELTIARLAGDRFAVLLYPVARMEAPALMARALIDALSVPLKVGDRSLRVDLAIGIAVYPDDARELDELIQNAERALRQAKRARGSSYQFYFAQLDARVRERSRLERDLSEALDQNALTLRYQPQFSAEDGRLTGVEALLRWTHPERGPVSPAVFVPLAEESGLIVPLGRWVLQQACLAAARWSATVPRVAVNVSSIQLQSPEFCADLLKILASTGLTPQHLELEITESAAMQDMEQTLAVLDQVRQAGVSVALDDFGTGHSSLSQLRRIPIDRLKIDQSFVRDVDSDDGKATIVRTIIGLGHSMGHEVIAEGVEQPGELKYLREHGCDELQGFVFSAALPMEELQERLARGGFMSREQRSLWFTV